MGVRGEVFSSRVILPNRTYFFNVKENRMGDLYLNIVESKNRETGGFDRQSVILFADDLQEFLKGFDESLKVMEKSVREKKRGGAGEKREERFERKEKADHGDRPERVNKTERGERAGRGEKARYKHTGEKSGRGEKAAYNRTGERSGRGDRNQNRRGERGSERGERGAKGGKRVVVRKQER